MSNYETTSPKGDLLIVDDTPDNLRFLSTTLVDRGYEVRCVLNGTMALTSAQTAPPTLILLDIKMPGLDGYEVCQQLKADPATREIPVIFLSALDEPINKVKAFAVGGADYITKPFQVEEVLIRIENQLTLQFVKAELYRLNAQLERRIQERTAQLEKANQDLRREIRDRQRAEASLRESQEQLRQEKELAQVTLHSIGDAVITTDEVGKIKYFNPVAEQLTGWNVQEAQGLPLSNVFTIVNEDTRKPVENPVERVLHSGQTVGLANHTILIARDGTEYAINDSAAPICDRQGRIIGTVMVFHDVTHSRNLSRQLSWQATHDALTGLANRRKFEQCLEEAISIARTAPLTASAKHQHQQHTLCYLDLDQFKIVNDTCGHIAGDELLRQVTALLRQRIRSTDTLARLGGDEFGLLLYQCPLAKGEQIADALRQLIQDFRFSWQGNSFAVGASIGLVEIDADTANFTSVLSAADAACYAAKDKGRNCIHVYRDNDQELARQRGERQWIARISEAIAENRFCLYSQKFVAIAPGRTEAHYEILLRLIDLEGNLVLPMAFIPAAERYNLMPAVDQWVINQFFASYERHCQMLTDINRRGRSLYTINLSGTSINNEQFLSFLKEQFNRYQVPPQTICFEITETTAIANLSRAAQLINEIKQIGCFFALDDFGNGMSSLTYLKNLPVDYLKIDGSFVKNLAHDPVDYAMVESFNQIARAMGIQTIAEFVEDELILEKLRLMGVDYAQGYGIARPSPLLFE